MILLSLHALGAWVSIIRTRHGSFTETETGIRNREREQESPDDMDIDIGTYLRWGGGGGGGEIWGGDFLIFPVLSN